MKYFIDNLIEKIEAKNSRICVGLDPHLNLMPTSILDPELLKNIEANHREIAAAILEFNQEIITAVADHTAVVKPQMAFYEKLGTAGMEALWETIYYAREKGLLILLDGKRNDIGSTAKAYAEAYLNIDSGADSLTINPYLGRDGITPFLEDKTKGAFALLKTSNPSSGDIQDLKLANGKKVYEEVALFLGRTAEKYKGQSGYSNLAAVVGATYPRELAQLRTLTPSLFFLIPGYGAQGGGAEDVKAAFDKEGRGAVINSSRGINFAYRKDEYKEFGAKNFADAAALAAKKMKEDINSVLDL